MLKERIFGSSGEISDKLEEYDKFSLEEILTTLTKTKDFIVFSDKEERKTLPKLEEQEFLIQDEEEKPNILLYEFTDGFYYVYTRKEEYEKETSEVIETNEEETSYGLFVPSGVTVRRVPQHTLGNGVLGRAFIHSNYIEILDRLVGAEYNEVLTHEVLHILHPEKGEKDIRLMTRNYVGSTIYN